MKKRVMMGMCLFLLLVCGSVSAAEEDDACEIGGPLAGVKLPLMPTEHGEAPGYPGCIDALAAKDTPQSEEERRFTAQGNNPVRELRPGSPEIYMAYMDKYMPVRAMFDRQSLVQAWQAEALSDSVEQYAAPLYWVSRHGYGEPTGEHWSPRPVVRLMSDTKPFMLNTDVLKTGLYCVKVVAAVPTDELERVRKPIILRMQVDDQSDGGTSQYHYRTGYVDEFYSVAEIYFHAPQQRRYAIELSAQRSDTPLYIWAVELHDVLAGIETKAVKTRSTLFTPEQRAQLRLQYKDKQTVEDISNSFLMHPSPDHAQRTTDERLARDATIWNAWIPLNAQPGGGHGSQRGYSQSLSLGAEGKDAKAIETDHGSWQPVGHFRNFDPEALSRVLMRNEKLGLEYTMDDLRNHRPLPEAYPYRDDGTGVYTAPQGDAPAQHWSPIAEAISARATTITQYLNWTAVPSYHYAGNEALGRDAAMILIRMAYDWPAIDGSNALSAVVEFPGGYGSDQHCRQRHTNFYNWPWYTEYHTFSQHYDTLFDLIDGNEELAQSVSRFVPWVKTSKDVLALLDAYLLRTSAKRILRYNWYTGEMKIALLATIQNDRSITDPWMHWLFNRTWVYPLSPSGIADLMVTGCGRNGPEYIASSYYALGESALPKARELEPYVAAGGNPLFNLSDPLRYPKPLMMCYWPMDATLAGRQLLRIGDVAGPDRRFGVLIDSAGEQFRQGWEWSKDPKFAWMLVHDAGRDQQSDAEWAEIESAAATIDRSPVLTQPSRAVTQWASILESGRQHDDHRFRRAVYVRTGSGWGHHHNDTLDLQVYAHGLPMTVDGGQRPNYSKPTDRSTRMHNVVEVDGLADRDGQWLAHSWTRALSDTQGVQYMHLQTVPPENHPDVSSYTRQVALIDVDEGKGAQPLAPAQLLSGAKLPDGVTTASSYIIDVVRVAGGKRHTYCFHGAISDAVTTNATAVVPIGQADAKDQLYVNRMAGERTAGVAPDHLVADFRMALEQDGPGMGEKEFLGQNYLPDSGRKITRLHLLGVEGQRVLRGALECVKWDYQIPMVFVQNRGPNEDTPDAPANLESTYVALIEPFSGDPFITSAQRTAVPGGRDVLHVTTATGRKDMVMVNPDGTFAFLSETAEGLQQITIVGGGGVTNDAKSDNLAVDVSTREGKVIAVDYAARSITVTGDWPMLEHNRTFEIGTGDHWTTYTAVAAKPAGDHTVITVRGGADFYLSRVRKVDAASSTVYCALGFAQNESRLMPGIDNHWVASNENATKFWRAEYLGGDRSEAMYGFKLDGPVSDADFGNSGGLRLWEYGVGDTARQVTSANLRRTGEGRFELTADTDVAVTIGGKTHRITIDTLRRSGGRVVIPSP